MADGAPSNLNSLEARLRNHCEAAAISFGPVRRHVAALVVAQMLVDSHTVVKGGRSLEIRYGIAATRASTDLDAVRTHRLDDLIGHLEQALDEGWAGFSGRVIDKGVIEAPVPSAYRPHRLDVKLSFQGRSFGTVQLEVAVEEAGGLAGTEAITSAEGAAIFAAVGLPEPDPVPVLPLPTQVAQKLHACTAPDTDEWINDRAHDLVDLQLIRRDLPDGQMAQVREACERLFAARQMHPWPPHVTARTGWALRYAREREGVEADVTEDIDAAVEWANRLIEQIVSA